MAGESLLPSDWSFPPLTELARNEPNSFVIGPFGSNLVMEDYRTSGVPVVFVRDVKPGAFRWKSNVYITAEKAEELRPHSVLPGDVVITKMGLPAGIAARYPDTMSPGIITADIIRIRPNEEVASGHFLSHALNAPIVAGQVRQITGGQTRPKLTLRDYKEVRVPLPPLPEQRKIAAILSSMDDTIEKTQAVIDQLEVVKQGLLGELLTRGMPGQHKEFKETEIGDIPVTWRICRLKEIAEVRTGLAKNSKRASGSTVELPYLRVANVQDGYLDLRKVKTIQFDAALIERYLLRDGDVLFNEGGDADKVGRGTVWRGQLPQCLHQNHVFVVRPSREVHPDFLSLYGGSARGKAYFLDAAKQTTNLASINSSQLKALPVPLPPPEEQRKIVEIAESLRVRKEAEEKALNALRHIKTDLLDSLLSGKLRVSTSAQEAA